MTATGSDKSDPTSLSVLLRKSEGRGSALRYVSAACYQNESARQALKFAEGWVKSEHGIEVVNRTGELSPEMLIACGEIVAALYSSAQEDNEMDAELSHQLDFDFT